MRLTTRDPRYTGFMTDPTVKIRKTQMSTERVHHAAGPLTEPLHRGWIAAVVENPFVGSDPVDVEPWIAACQPLANALAEELRDALVTEGREIQGYGKGAIVGVGGELEIAATWHIPAGAGLRHALNGPKAIVPSSKKVGVLGSQLDIPIQYIHAAYLRSHYDAMPVCVPDGPRPNEVLYALVMSTGERPNSRLPGFTIDDVIGEDGLR